MREAKVSSDDNIQIHPIDQEHNVWFDEDGNQRERYRAGWAKDPATGKMVQTGEPEDTFLDKQGRQGEGYVAYHGDRPVGSLTYVSDPNGWHMIGTTFVHPDYREQGLFNRMAEPLRATGQPVDAYVWNNPWLKQKVRGWQMTAGVEDEWHERWKPAWIEDGMRVPPLYQPGARVWFEYHCHEGHDSSDTHLWYRTHQPVTVLSFIEGDDEASFADRGGPMYRVRFDDGTEGDVGHDELYDDPSHFDGHPQADSHQCGQAGCGSPIGADFAGQTAEQFGKTVPPQRLP